MTVRRQALVEAFKAPFDVRPSERVPALGRKVGVILDNVDASLRTLAALNGAPATGEQDEAARLRVRFGEIDTEKSDAAEDLAKVKASAEDLLRRCQGLVASTGAERLGVLRRSAGDKEEATAVADILAEMGPSALDAIILSMGESKTEADTRLVREAMSQRFKKTITGDLTHERATKTYRLLASVPEAHVADNAAFENLELASWSAVAYFGSLIYAPAIDVIKKWYTGEDPKEETTTSESYFSRDDKKMVLNYTKSNFILSADFQMPSIKTGSEGEWTWTEHFSHTTLHEIGHAVDDGMGIMKRIGRDGDCGAWKEETPETIANEAAGSFGLYAEFPGVKRSALHAFLAATLAGKDPADTVRALTDKQAFSAEEAVHVETFAGLATWTTVGSEEWRTQYDKADGSQKLKMRFDILTALENESSFPKQSKMVNSILVTTVNMACEGKDIREFLDAFSRENVGAPLSEGDMSRLLKHKAVSWCKSIKTGPRGVWWGSDPESLKLEDGRIYQESYENQWWSYDAEARKHGLSKYQFRAPGEWFAELYAFYHDDKLPPNHKHHDLISRI